MANILFRGTTAPTQPVLVSGGSVAKNSPLTLEEGDWNYKALNDDIQTRATSLNPSLTGIVNFQYNIRSALAKYNKYVAGLNGTIPAAGCKIGEYIPTGNAQNATLILDIVLRSNGQYARAKSTIAIRSETLPVVTATIQTELENNDVLGLTIETWIDASTGKVVFFAVPTGVVSGNISFDVVSYERDVYNAFNLATSIIEKDAVGLTQVVATAKKINTGDITAVSFSGNGSGLTSLNATNLSSGTISGERGVEAGSNSVSFIKYNGVTKAAGNFDSGTTNPSNTNRLNFDGHFYVTKFYGSGIASGDANVSFVTYNGTSTGAGVFDGGSTAPSATTRLNYGGYFYATRFYGDGSNLTSINAGNISSGTLSLARGGTGGTDGQTATAFIDASRFTNTTVSNDNDTLVVGKTYSADCSAGSYNLYLPAAPEEGQSIEIYDLNSSWGNTNVITITRTTASHTFNGITTDAFIELDTNKARRIKFTYIETNRWAVSFG